MSVVYVVLFLLGFAYLTYNNLRSLDSRPGRRVHR